MSSGERNLRELLGDTVVVDAHGDPLVVYRGEHGASGRILESRAASLAFGDRECANLYAMEPNDHVRDPFPTAPRVVAAYLRIERPFINAPDDPFVDLSRIRETLGAERATAHALRFACWIEDTAAWHEKIDADQHIGSNSIADEIKKNRESFLQTYYVHAFPLLDDELFIKDLIRNGFDGAIHGGYGANYQSVEYRIFDPSQVVFVFAGWENRTKTTIRP